jgi:N-acetylneuraminate lyase
LNFVSSSFFSSRKIKRIKFQHKNKKAYNFNCPFWKASKSDIVKRRKKKMANIKFEGVIPALVTPLNDDESVRVSALKPLIDYLCDKGAYGFYVGGATGEGLALATEQRMILAEESKKAIGGRVPMIVQVAAGDYNDAILLAKHAESIGADAISATPPMFFQYDKDDVYNYYKRLAESVSIPLMIYFNPAAGFNINAKFAARAFEVDNITAIKWTSSNYYEMISLREKFPEANIFNGPDEMLVCGLSAGADGGIGSTYNIIFPIINEIYQSFREGNTDKAREAQKKADKIIRVILKYSVIPVVKMVLEERGIEVGNASFPMVSYNSKQRKQILSDLKEAGFVL